jgi:hypothetical protein
MIFSLFSISSFKSVILSSVGFLGGCVGDDGDVIELGDDTDSTRGAFEGAKCTNANYLCE